MLQQFYPQTPHDYRYEINKDLNFSAAHYVPHTGAGICQRVHGHTYFVNVTIAGDTLDELGFLVDFKVIKQVIHSIWDHSLLNDDTRHFSDKDSNHFPTTEVVARTIWENIQRELDTKSNQPKCIQVMVRETPTSYAVFRPKKGEDY